MEVSWLRVTTECESGTVSDLAISPVTVYPEETIMKGQRDTANL